MAFNKDNNMSSDSSNSPPQNEPILVSDDSTSNESIGDNIEIVRQHVHLRIPSQISTSNSSSSSSMEASNPSQISMSNSESSSTMEPSNPMVAPDDIPSAVVARSSDSNSLPDLVIPESITISSDTTYNTFPDLTLPEDITISSDSLPDLIQEDSDQIIISEDSDNIIEVPYVTTDQAIPGPSSKRKSSPILFPMTKKARPAANVSSPESLSDSPVSAPEIIPEPVSDTEIPEPVSDIESLPDTVILTYHHNGEIIPSDPSSGDE